MKLFLPDEGLTTQLNIPRFQLSQGPGPQSEEEPLLVEHLLEVYINEVLTYKLVCSPAMLPELLLGRLLTEGVIKGLDQVDVLYFCKEGLRARVFLNRETPEQAEPAVETVASCCTGNRTLSDLFADQTPPPPLAPIPYEPEWIYRLSGAIDSRTPLYAATHSAHSCVLMREGEILICAEDIGRHNAMDKAIGWALLHQVPLSQCIIYTSGRVPVDMTIKAIRAGIPILVSKALPTDQAVRLAKEFHLILIGGAHPDSFKVFAGAGLPEGEKGAR